VIVIILLTLRHMILTKFHLDQGFQVYRFNFMRVSIAISSRGHWQHFVQRCNSTY